MSVRAKVWTRAEYDRLIAAGAFAPDTRVQLVQGEIVEMTPQSRAHAVAVMAVEEALRDVFQVGYTIQVQMPLALGPTAEPEPGIAVIPGHFREYRDHPTTAVLVVEVADTSLEFDRSRKAAMYAEAGILEYWILSLVDRRLEVYRDARGPAYETRLMLGPEETVSPLAAADASVRIGSLLP